MERKNQLRISKLLTFTCLFIYIASYVSRHNYSAALAEIINSGMFTKAKAGIIGTVYFAVYGGGQIVFGYIADRISPYKLITTGLFGTAFANLLMSFAKTIPQMTLFWGLNGVFQAMLWPGIFYMISNLVVKEYREEACLVMSIAVPVGTMSGYFLAGFAIQSGWKYAFLYPSFVVFTVAVLFVVISFYFRKNMTGEKETTIEKSGEKTPAKQYYNILISSGVLLILIPTLLHGMLRDGINAWVPTMITETYTVTPSFSVFVSLALPIINLSGAYISMFMYKRLKNNEVTTACISLVIGIFPVTVLLFLNKINLFTSIFCLSMVTTFITSFNHMIVTMLPLRFSKYNRAATLTGTLNSLTYAGCALSNYLFGYTSDTYGWNATVYVWLAIFVIGAVISGLIIKKWSRFIKE